MLRYVTAGESHGEFLTAILEGIPAGLKITCDEINRELKRRQKGYGRGKRMSIESDKVTIAGGIRWGETMGSPVCLMVRNRDWENWKNVMSVDAGDLNAKLFLTKPRPGHADLAGILKYMRDDIRDISERASARETAARVAVGSVCRKFLAELGIKVYSYVAEIGGVKAKPVSGKIARMSNMIEDSPVRCPDKAAGDRMLKAIDEATLKGDSLGGIFSVIVTGVPAGLGSHSQWDMKLDGRLAQALVSIQAVKGVEFGMGFELGRINGSKAHDEILYARTGGYYRNTNNAGGIEGGITTGEDIVLSAVMKPIPSLKKPLKSVDIRTKKPVTAEVVRADVCAVPACSVIAESVTAFEIACAAREKYGGDSMTEVVQRHKKYIEYLRKA